jgi:hypothetical protein
MTGCCTLLMDQTRAATEARMELVDGSGASYDEAMRAALLFENSTEEDLSVAEPHGQPRLELVLDGGIGVLIWSRVQERELGAHFENLEKSGKVGACLEV